MLFLVNFDPSFLSHFVTHPGPPRKYVTHLGPPIFSRSSTKNSGQKTPVQILSIVRGAFCPRVLSRGLLSGRFCPGLFLSVPLLSEYICYNRKLNITLNF